MRERLDRRDTFKIVFYACHDKPSVSITPVVINGSTTDTIVRPSHRDTINFCRIIRGWKTAWTWPPLTFLSPSRSPCFSFSLTLFSLRLCSIHISLPPLRATSRPPVHLCTFIESRPVNCFTGGAVANSNDVSVLAVTLKVTPPDEGTDTQGNAIRVHGRLNSRYGSKCSRY